MAFDPEQITYFAETDFRNQKTRFGIKAKDRPRHMYVIGNTGVGKSTLLENMAIQDVKNGNGIGILDPHGSFVEKILDYIPQHRIKDVVYFAPFDTNYPVSFNVLEDVGADKRHFVVSGLMSTFKKIWVDAWSARMEYILNNILLALLEYPGSTLLGVNRMLADKDYRNKVVANATDPGVKAFWLDEFAKYGDRYMQEAGAAIQNKIGQFVANPLIRNIIGQPKSSFNFRTAMDGGKIVVMNLSKGRIGEQNTSLLGSMLITKIYLAAMSRADVHPTKLAELPNFYFYVDEFQSFANETFANILSEARKYKLNLIIAHQYVAQMEESVRDAVFGNVGTLVSFRVGPLDAELLEKAFSQHFTPNDMVSLGMGQIYLTLMIDGTGSKPFSAKTFLPIPFPEISFRNDVIEYSRATYAVPKEEVEKGIADWYVKEEPPARERPPRQDFQPQAQQFRPPQQGMQQRPSFQEQRPYAPSNTSRPGQYAPRPQVPAWQKPEPAEQPKEHQPFKAALDTMQPLVQDEPPQKKEEPKQSLQSFLAGLDLEKKPEQPAAAQNQSPAPAPRPYRPIQREQLKPSVPVLQPAAPRAPVVSSVPPQPKFATEEKQKEEPFVPPPSAVDQNPFLPNLRPKPPRVLERVATEDSKAMLRSVIAKTAAPSKPGEEQSSIPKHEPQATVERSSKEKEEVSHEVLKKVFE